MHIAGAHPRLRAAPHIGRGLVAALLALTAPACGPILLNIPRPAEPAGVQDIPPARASTVRIAIVRPTAPLRDAIASTIENANVGGFSVQFSAPTVEPIANGLATSISAQFRRHEPIYVDNPFHGVFGGERWRVGEVTIEGRATLRVATTFGWDSAGRPHLVVSSTLDQLSGSGTAQGNILFISGNRAVPESVIRDALRPHAEQTVATINGRMQAWVDSQLRYDDFVSAATRDEVGGEGRFRICVRPLGIRVTPIDTTADQIRTTVEVRVRITTRGLPDPDPSWQCVADPVTFEVIGGAPAPATPSLNAHALAFVGLATLQEALREGVVGSSFEVENRRLTVSRIAASQFGGSGLMLEVDVDGDVRGTLYLVGHIAYDPATMILSVPDLDFEVGTSDIVLRLASWIMQGQLRERLRTAATYSLASQVEPAIQAARELRLRGVGPSDLVPNITEVTPEVITIRDNAVWVSLRAHGTFDPAPAE